ncbi:uncharacterized protein PRCAT00001847001 [Priceomyces carsonii]|uniref:uncharacterized protein n=1 Tax=Priceomyces carsonii TaxID=28549 RepID=UPI002ED8DEB8|nr:unnamed protein product [Priceomyces carsonii]
MNMNSSYHYSMRILTLFFSGDDEKKETVKASPETKGEGDTSAGDSASKEETVPTLKAENSGQASTTDTSQQTPDDITKATGIPPPPDAGSFAGMIPPPGSVMQGVPGLIPPVPQDFQQFQQQLQSGQAPPLPPQPPQQPPQQAMPPSSMGKESGKMFIGGLNWDTTEQGLVDYFTKFGEVVDHTIMRDNNTGKSRGFGFLTFKDPKSVDEVIKRDHILDGKLIDPKRAIAREEQDKVGKIFVGGIDPMVNEKEFNDFFAQFGSIIDAQLMIDKDTGRSRGFGFITYDSPDAVDRVTVNKYLNLKGKAMEVKRAEPRGQHQQNQQNQQNQQQQQLLQYGMYGGYNQYGQAPYQQNSYGQGMNGMSPEMMQEYWQRMQQWYMYQQQAAQAQAATGEYSQLQAQLGDQPSQPLNPQQAPEAPKPQEVDHNLDSSSSYRDQRKSMPPRGPRRAPPAGPSGNSRGRGGYQHRNKGYHPYSRGGRR